MILPAPIQNLINALSRLPGIGPKTASRLTFYLLNIPDDLPQDLAAALQALKTETAYCQICYNITDAGRLECEICADPDRDQSTVCVVEDPLDVLALERTDGFSGRYHVLGGALSPIEGISPENLKIRQLLERVRAGGKGDHSGDESQPGGRRHFHVPAPAAGPARRAGHPPGAWPAGRRGFRVRRSIYLAEGPFGKTGDGQLID